MGHIYFSMALLIMRFVQKWKGTNLKMHECVLTALLHISWVLKISGINSRERGFLTNSLLHASWTTRPTTGVYFNVCNKICLVTLLNKLIIFMPLTSGEAQILWSKNLLYLIIRHKKPFFLCPQFYCLLLLIFRNTPIPPSWWMPSKSH